MIINITLIQVDLNTSGLQEIFNDRLISHLISIIHMSQLIEDSLHLTINLLTGDSELPYTLSLVTIILTGGLAYLHHCTVHDDDRPT